MICKNKEEFLLQISENKSLLGLDVGSKTIGIAISDTTHTIASPHSTIKRTKFSRDIRVLNDIIKENSIAGLIVGLPLSVDSGDNKMTQSIRQFVRNYLREKDLPVFWWDERFSTKAAERPLLDADMSRKKRAKVIDKVAASLILQGFLDSL